MRVFRSIIIHYCFQISDALLVYIPGFALYKKRPSIRNGSHINFIFQTFWMAIRIGSDLNITLNIIKISRDIQYHKIGRASCRERVEIAGRGGAENEREGVADGKRAQS